MRRIDLSGKWRGMALCLAAGLMLTACGELQQPDNTIVVDKEENTISYEFAVVEIGEVELSERVRCTYKQQEEQEVSFSLTGRLVDKVYVEEGDLVKKGTLLAQLSTDNLERDVEDLNYWISKNELKMKQIDENESLDIQDAWVRYINSGAGDKKSTEESVEAIRQNYRYQREDCQDALELDRMKLEKTQRELKGCKVYSEIDGIVYKIKEDLYGSTSKADEVVITIVDNTKCLFEAQSPEVADCFHEGEAVEMVINVGTAAGTYTLLPHEIESWDDVQQFTILDGPMTSGIEVGTSGTIRFIMEKKDQVLCIPIATLNEADGKYYVYVVDESGMRQVRWVEVGLIGNTMAEILSGLEEGEKVIRR